MKKLLVIGVLALGLMSFTSENSDANDCNSFASVSMAYYEQQNGCLSSADYNAGWNALYSWCEENWY